MNSPLDRRIHRRDLFRWAAHGLGGAAVASLLANERVRAEPVPGEAMDRPPHHPAKAKRVIHICLLGGLSHLDSFDYKPALAKYHGKPLPSSEKPETFFGQVGLLRKNDWDFRRSAAETACGSRSYFPISLSWRTN